MHILLLDPCPFFPLFYSNIVIRVILKLKKTFSPNLDQSCGSGLTFVRVQKTIMVQNVQWKAHRTEYIQLKRNIKKEDRKEVEPIFPNYSRLQFKNLLHGLSFGLCVCMRCFITLSWLYFSYGDRIRRRSRKRINNFESSLKGKICCRVQVEIQ